MKLSKVLVCFILVALAVSMVSPILKIQEAHATITGVTLDHTSDSDVYGVGYPNEIKSFYANGLWWVFYINNTDDIWYTVSPSGNAGTWNASTAIAGSAPRSYYYAFTFDGIYLHYVQHRETGDSILYRRGIPEANGTITWSAAEQTITAANWIRVSIAVDTNGHAWVFYITANKPYITLNDNTDGTWATNASYPAELSATTNTKWCGSVLALTDGKVAVIYVPPNDVGVHPQCRIYDGTLNSAENITTTDADYGWVYSALAINDTIHFMLSPHIGYLYVYAVRTWGVGWGSTENAATKGGAPNLVYDGGFLYNIFVSGNTFSIQNKTIGSSWNAATTIIDESSEHIPSGSNSYSTTNCALFPNATNDNAGLLYITGTANPYNIKFAVIPLTYGEPPVVVTIASPTNTTYPSSNISVSLTTTGGTIDKQWYNVKNGSAWVYPSNVTYSSPTTMTGFINGTYTFYGYANNTGGNLGNASVTFSVSILTVLVSFTAYPNMLSPQVTINGTGLNQLLSGTSSSVGNCSDSTHSIGYPNQHKTFYANGLYWVFVINGTDYIAYTTSNTGVDNWTNPITIVTDSTPKGYDFAVTFDGTYLHYVRHRETSDALRYRRGVPEANGTITWSQAEQAIISGNYVRVNIAVDTNGYAWVYASIFESGDHFPYLPYLFKNNQTDGTWTTDTGYPFLLNAVWDVHWSGSIIPMTNGKVAIIYGSEEGFPNIHPTCRIYDGSMGAEENITEADWLDYGWQYSCIAVGDDLHYAYRPMYTGAMLYVMRTWGVGWGTPESLGAKVTPFLSYDGSRLYAMWATGTHVYIQNKTIGAAWGTVSAVITELANIPSGIQSFSAYSAAFTSATDNGTIGLMYLTGVDPSLNIRFGLISLASNYVVPFNVTLLSGETYVFDVTSPTIVYSGSTYNFSSWLVNGTLTYNTTSINLTLTGPTTFRLNYPVPMIVLASPTGNVVAIGTVIEFSSNVTGGTPPYDTSWWYAYTNGSYSYIGHGESINVTFDIVGIYFVYAQVSDLGELVEISPLLSVYVYQSIVYVEAYHDSSLIAVYVVASGPNATTRTGTTTTSLSNVLNWSDCTPGLWSVTATYGGIPPTHNSGPVTLALGGNATILLTWITPAAPSVPTLNLLWQYLLAGNLIGFIFACYTVTIGQGVFVLIAILISVPLYVRLKNLTVLAIAWILLGGVLITAMPIVSPFAVLLTVLGIAAVIYKIFQHVT